MLLIDAQQGVRQQSRHHGYLLHLLGNRQVVVIINKMDAVAFAAERYAAMPTPIATTSARWASRRPRSFPRSRATATTS